MLLQDEFTPYVEQSEFIEHILGDSFPWYWNETIYDGKSDRPYYFTHTLITRDGEINSQYWEGCLDLFDSFCRKHNIEYTDILRASINCSVTQKRTSPGIHRDHSEDHSIFLLYLNDSDGDLKIYENRDLSITIQPKEMRAVMLDGQQHDFDYPSIGNRRVVLVVTFKRVKEDTIIPGE